MYQEAGFLSTSIGATREFRLSALRTLTTAACAP
jgi:hypothetical protein